MIKGLIFDKDGTLFDFSRSWCAWAVGFLSRIAPSHEDAVILGRAIGFDVSEQKFEPESVVIAGTPSEIAKKLQPFLVNHTAQDIVSIMNAEAARASQVEAVALVPLFRRFREAGFTLGVVTNDAEGPAHAHLKSAGIDGFLDFVAGFDSGFGAKPGPGQLEAFLDASGLRAYECVMVGDSTHDLIAGRGAGMHCVGVLTGMATPEVLHPFADAVLPDIGHLPHWLEQAS